MSELSSYKFVVAELGRLIDILNIVEQDRSGKSINGEHISSGIGDRTAMTAAKIVDLQDRIKRLTKQKNDVESYIKEIKHPLIKYACMERFIDDTAYGEIALELRRRGIKIRADAIRKRVERYVNKM